MKALDGPAAFVIGDLDLIRPLKLAGVRSVVFTAPGHPAAYSRLVDRAVEVEPERRLERLIEEAEREREPPVLLYGDDAGALLASRNRDRLAESFRFLMPDPSLVEDLLDKHRFLELERRLDLPVPPTVALSPDEPPIDLPLDFPLVVKPLPYRVRAWYELDSSGAKVLVARDRAALEALWRRARKAGVGLLAQELISGSETRVLSYHVYVNREGEVATEFTGRKIRTSPPSFGWSTAVETTHDPEVVELGRKLIRRLGMRGPAKLDLKRASDGSLHLLEVNPRLSLWVHAGALAGANIPAAACADLVHLPQPPSEPVRSGVRWMNVRGDRTAARSLGVPLRRWLGEVARADARSHLAWDDPLPLLRGRLLPQLGRRTRSA